MQPDELTALSPTSLSTPRIIVQKSDAADEMSHLHLAALVRYKWATGRWLKIDLAETELPQRNHVSNPKSTSEPRYRACTDRTATNRVVSFDASFARGCRDSQSQSSKRPSTPDPLLCRRCADDGSSMAASAVRLPHPASFPTPGRYRNPGLDSLGRVPQARPPCRSPSPLFSPGATAPELRPCRLNRISRYSPDDTGASG